MWLLLPWHLLLLWAFLLQSHLLPYMEFGSPRAKNRPHPCSAFIQPWLYPRFLARYSLKLWQKLIVSPLWLSLPGYFPCEVIICLWSFPFFVNVILPLWSTLHHCTHPAILTLTKLFCKHFSLTAPSDHFINCCLCSCSLVSFVCSSVTAECGRIFLCFLVSFLPQ